MGTDGDISLGAGVGPRLGAFVGLVVAWEAVAVVACFGLSWYSARIVADHFVTAGFDLHSFSSRRWPDPAAPCWAPCIERAEGRDLLLSAWNCSGD